MGRISDTEYHKVSGYLEDQRDFQNADLVTVLPETPEDTEVILWSNVLDKGYQYRAATWRCGKQRTFQPVFGNSDQNFKDRDTIMSGSMNSKRSGNEWGVNISKRPGCIKEGFKVNMDPHVVFNDVWLCWAFQANFIYYPAVRCLLLVHNIGRTLLTEEFMLDF